MLAGALEALGIDAEKRQPTIDALGTRLDLRRLPAATGLTATRDASGRVSALAVRTRADRYVRVVEDASGSTTASEVALPTLTRIDSASGQIVSSVYQALSASPWHTT